MAEHGGYRKPANPAPVSPPGAMSQRTDGGPGDPKQAARDLPDAKYGEQANFQAIQGGAPLAAAPPAPAVIPLGAPTNRPDEPVTAGNPLGAGVGPEAAGVDTRTPLEQDAAALQSFLPALRFMANLPDASPSTRALLRRIQGNS